MRRDHTLVDRLTEQLDLVGEPIPSQTVVEIGGENRVLIENHMGIIQFGSDKICVKVKFGHIAVCGCNLELNRMTREQLVISGRIDMVALHRRNAG